MNKYELTVILKNKEAEEVKVKVNEIIEKNNVKVESEDLWGVKKLAYDIDGEKEGYYLFYNLEASPDIIKKIIGAFRLNANILRYLFVKLNQKIDQKESA